MRRQAPLFKKVVGRLRRACEGAGKDLLMSNDQALLPADSVTPKPYPDLQRLCLYFGFQRTWLAVHVSGVNTVDAKYTRNAVV